MSDISPQNVYSRRRACSVAQHRLILPLEHQIVSRRCVDAVLGSAMHEFINNITKIDIIKINDN
ncbi:hypothetical protein B6N31_07220 [Dickeya fangzhongdai]|nr:hypothetical protein B6N31_07220 [Dickeya fangzhongdai]